MTVVPIEVLIFVAILVFLSGAAFGMWLMKHILVKMLEDIHVKLEEVTRPTWGPI